eukprot:8038490-Ditylum_brightwellii.AAC.1
MVVKDSASKIEQKKVRNKVLKEACGMWKEHKDFVQDSTKSTAWVPLEKPHAQLSGSSRIMQFRMQSYL